MSNNKNDITQEIHPRFFTILTFSPFFLENNTQISSDMSHDASRKNFWHTHEAVHFRTKLSLKA